MYKETLLFPSGNGSNYRIPSIAVNAEGDVVAFCNDRKNTLADHASEVTLTYCRRDAVGEWSKVRSAAGAPGFSCAIGAAVYIPQKNRIVCTYSCAALTRNEFGIYSEEETRRFREEAEKKAKERGIALGARQVYTDDGGKTFTEAPFPEASLQYTDLESGKTGTAQPWCHGSGAGIALKSGRIVCPARYATGEYADLVGIRTKSYNCVLYSDDAGESWACGGSVQVGTGEGTVIEEEDGSLLFSSRAYFADGKRYLALSRDGGLTFTDTGTDPFLKEDIRSGCNAALLRVPREKIADSSLLPEGADGITLFSNPRSDGRDHMTVCFSFDGGKTWAGSKTVCPDNAAYSSLAFSEREQLFLLLYEKGGGDNPYRDGIAIAEFDLSWLLG